MATRARAGLRSRHRTTDVEAWKRKSPAARIGQTRSPRCLAVASVPYEIASKMLRLLALPLHRYPEQSKTSPPPPPPPVATRPGGPSGGFALPGLPSRPPPADEEEEQEREEEETPAIPTRDYEDRDPSPVRIAVPVARGPEPELEPPARSLPARPIPVPEEIPAEEDLPEEEEAYDPRAAAAAVAELSLGSAHSAPGPATGGKKALIQYDYEKGRG